MHLHEGFAEGEAKGLGFDHLTEFAADRLLGLPRDDPEAVAHRYTRTHTAGDDVDRCRQFVDERLDAPLSKIRDEPEGQPEAAGEHGPETCQRITSGDQDHEAKHHCHHNRDGDVLIA